MRRRSENELHRFACFPYTTGPIRTYRYTPMRKLLQNEQGHWNAQIIAALIAAAATLLTAIIAGVFGLLQLRAANAPDDAPLP